VIDPACPFCAIVTGAADAFVVSETPETVAFLDRRPVFDGHTLLVPRDHLVTLADVPHDLLAPLFAQAQRLARAMQDGLGADGAFVALNNVVSQSVAHVHVHVVPRRFKDGLRGFFWPRTKYRDDTHAGEVASRLRVALTPQS
jgi:histidine triad (HIT) family protein